MIISQRMNTIESIRIIHVMCSKRPRIQWLDHKAEITMQTNKQQKASDEENVEADRKIIKNKKRIQSKT